jgi:2-oxoacid:acceptor oxidoreductase delta subunit (pyruvate/2-ketoisovalerate family)
MPELKAWEELETGGAVAASEAVQPETAGWRTGLKPLADLDACINCLLCWLYCPDSAVLLDGTTFVGFDERYCKGCEICAEICPVNAVAMVRDGD